MTTLDTFDALLAESRMQLTVVVPDEGKVEALRRQYDARGLQGRRREGEARGVGGDEQERGLARVRVFRTNGEWC